MSSVEPTTENRCYRHPKRESFVRCQRCGRTICGDCQTLAAVGVHCPECVREGRQSAPSSRPITTRVARALSPSSQRPVVTYTIIALAIIGFVIEVLTGDNPISGNADGPVGHALAYYPGSILQTPWTIITVNFDHANFLHILFNMYSLFVVGPPLERFLGRTRFAVLFFLSGIGGVVAIDFFSKYGAVGASGAIFGLLGALIVFSRRIGIRAGQLYFVIALNLAIGFIIPQIAWQAHIGGLIVGFAVALLLLETRARKWRALQIAGLVVIALAMIVTLVIHAYALGTSF